VLPGPSVTFTWSGAVGQSSYELYIGSTGVGSNNLYNSGSKTASTLAVTGLPTNGETIYVRLLTDYNGSYAYSDYTYTAATHGILATPAPGSTLTATSVTFTLTPATGTEATDYELWIGSTGVGADEPLLLFRTTTSLPVGTNEYFPSGVTAMPNGEPPMATFWLLTPVSEAGFAAAVVQPGTLTAAASPPPALVPPVLLRAGVVPGWCSAAKATATTATTTIAAAMDAAARDRHHGRPGSGSATAP